MRVRIFTRTDGLINLYIRHPSYIYSPAYKKQRDSNKTIINHIRKVFPEVRNEFREVPVQWYTDGTYGWTDRHFCAYGLTKAQYALLKLSWTFVEIKVSDKRSEIIPRDYFDITMFGNPTTKCEERFSKPGFKQKPLRIV
jgi:hypothetical protein